MISVIIPALNEATGLTGLLDQLSQEAPDHEVIVVDGGSRDATADVARAADVRLVFSMSGRGQQIATGATLAQGETLLFLHADCSFPQGGLAAIERRLASDGRCPGGNFRLLFLDGTSFCRWLTRFYASIRARGHYYGDSGIFVRRSVYDDLGGIRPIALMEDYDFTRRLERVGPTCCIDEPALVTSGRRFEGRRPWAIVTGWLVIHALFHLGVSPERLARIYDSKRRLQRRAPWFHRHTKETSS